MDSPSRALLEAARTAMLQAHAPYSGFRVGAALRAPSGAIYSGCNVENAAYPLGLCAEAGAIAAMVRGGERLIEAIAIVGGDGRGVMPCGGCRQRIAEFAGAGTRIIAAGRSGEDVAEYRCDELLPFAFGRDAFAPATVAAPFTAPDPARRNDTR